ncbi:MFS transporter [Micromonospora echinospora]|uniref:MFS transporter n=1 Tax=Micromonospora echinospora TaxID=1877 RepID=UPI00343E15F8
MVMRERFGPLADPKFRLFWIGNSTSLVGDAIMPVTLVFAILSVGGSLSEVGMVLGTSLAVRVALLVIGGTLADRFPRRLLMVGCDLSLAVVQTAVFVLLATGHGSIWMLLAAAVFYGIASALSKPALTGLLPQMVATERLQQANALMSISRSAAQIIGPALAGLIIAVASPAAAYLLDAGTYLVSAITLLLLRLPPVARKSRGKLFQDIAAGWREVVSRPWYWMGLCCHAVWNLGASVFVVLGPVIVNEQLGGASRWGLVATSAAVGSLLGGFVALRWRPRRPLISGHLCLLLSVPQLAALFAPSPVVVLMAAATMHAIGVAIINQIWVTALQQLIPEAVISRVSSYDWLISMIVAPLGLALTGPLAEHAGTPFTLGVAITLVTVPVLAILVVPGIRAVRQSHDGKMFFPDSNKKPDASSATSVMAGSDGP